LCGAGLNGGLGAQEFDLNPIAHHVASEDVRFLDASCVARRNG
jgi:hypothetical protein